MARIAASSSVYCRHAWPWCAEYEAQTEHVVIQKARGKPPLFYDIVVAARKAERSRRIGRSPTKAPQGILEQPTENCRRRSVERHQLGHELLKVSFTRPDSHGMTKAQHGAWQCLPRCLDPRAFRARQITPHFELSRCCTVNPLRWIDSDGLGIRRGGNSDLDGVALVSQRQCAPGHHRAPLRQR
jgi:hypothetical protein